jgi:hypothetical protein
MATLQPPPESSPRPPHGAPAVTELLLAWGAGDPAALDALLPVVYEELRQQARRALRREGVGHTLRRLVGDGRARVGRGAAVAAARAGPVTRSARGTGRACGRVRR